MWIWDLIEGTLDEVLSAVSGGTRDYIIAAVAIIIVQLCIGGIFQMFAGAFGVVLNIRGVRGKK